MLHLQYYNSLLKNKHIGKILNNYKLRYLRTVNEIESKVNEMVKLFLKDILAFLENIEEVAEQKHKINEYDKNKKEFEIMKQKLKTKTYCENKLRNDYDLLQQENNLLKLKINALNKKIQNLRTNNLNNSHNSISPEKSERNHNRTNRSMPKKSNPSMTPKIGKQNNLYIVLNNSSIMEQNFDNKSDIDIFIPKKSKFNKSEKNLKNFRNIKSKQLNKTVIQKKKIDANKFVNNKIIKSNKNNGISSKNLRKSYDKKNYNLTPKYSGDINKKNNNKNNTLKNESSRNLKLNNISIYNPLNILSADLPSNNLNLNSNYEELGKNINEAFDSELKELDQDEANIELLLEQLNNEFGTEE